MSRETIDNAIQDIVNNQLDDMREKFNATLSAKAVEALDDRKIEIAHNYFGLERVEEESKHDYKPWMQGKQDEYLMNGKSKRAMRKEVRKKAKAIAHKALKSGKK